MPFSLSMEALHTFDADFRPCISISAWQLTPQTVHGINPAKSVLRLSHHSCAAYIASLSSSGYCGDDDAHLKFASNICLF